MCEASGSGPWLASGGSELESQLPSAFVSRTGSRVLQMENRPFSLQERGRGAGTSSLPDSPRVQVSRSTLARAGYQQIYGEDGRKEKLGKLPEGWVEVVSKRNNKTFYYNVNTHRAMWSRPFRTDDVPIHAGLRLSNEQLEGRQLLQSLSIVEHQQAPHTDKDLLARAAQTEIAEMEFSTAMLRYGPRVLLARVLLKYEITYFNLWRENARLQREERIRKIHAAATRIQAGARRKLVLMNLEERRKEYIKRLKCHDFPDIRMELVEVEAEMSNSMRQWFETFKSSYLKKSMSAKQPPRKKPKCKSEDCLRPYFLVQKNGYCVECNFVMRNPEKAATAKVLARMGLSYS